MLLVKIVNQFLHIPEILFRFPACPYVILPCPLYEIMELPVVSLRVGDLVGFPFVRDVDDRWLRFRWRLDGGRRCIAVEQQDVENVVLPDGILKF